MQIISEQLCQGGGLVAERDDGTVRTKWNGLSGLNGLELVSPIFPFGQYIVKCEYLAIQMNIS